MFVALSNGSAVIPSNTSPDTHPDGKTPMLIAVGVVVGVGVLVLGAYFLIQKIRKRYSSPRAAAVKYKAPVLTQDLVDDGEGEVQIMMPAKDEGMTESPEPVEATQNGTTDAIVNGTTDAIVCNNHGY